MKLRSCPWCWSDDLTWVLDPETGLYHVDCSCGARGPHAKFLRVAEERWNYYGWIGLFRRGLGK